MYRRCSPSWGLLAVWALSTATLHLGLPWSSPWTLTTLDRLLLDTYRHATHTQTHLFLYHNPYPTAYLNLIVTWTLNLSLIHQKAVSTLGDFNFCPHRLVCIHLFIHPHREIKTHTKVTRVIFCSFPLSPLHALSIRRWCWTNGRCVRKLKERVTSWFSLRCSEDSAQRWGNLQFWRATKVYSSSKIFPFKPINKCEMEILYSVPCTW